jgi:hypothetical protein
LHPPEPRNDREALFEIYSAVQEIHKKLDTICENYKREDRRIGRLEQWRATITGGLAIIGIIAGVALGHVLRIWLP